MKMKIEISNAEEMDKILEALKGAKYSVKRIKWVRREKFSKPVYNALFSRRLTESLDLSQKDYDGSTAAL